LLRKLPSDAASGLLGLEAMKDAERNQSPKKGVVRKIGRNGRRT